MTTHMTVVSAFHSREDAVGLSVRSFARQTCQSFRAVFVDGTWARLQSYAGAWIEVRRQRNRGFTGTMITLSEEADTEFVALHGAKDESLPERLDAQLTILRAHSNVVAVGCAIENVDEVTGRH